MKKNRTCRVLQICWHACIIPALSIHTVLPCFKLHNFGTEKGGGGAFTLGWEYAPSIPVNVGDATTTFKSGHAHGC